MSADDIVTRLRALAHGTLLDADAQDVADDAADEIESLCAERDRLRAALDDVRAIAPRPEILCLCGATRFADEFRRQNLRPTLEGRIVLLIGYDAKSDDGLEANP